jgi:hypothetical protein
MGDVRLVAEYSAVREEWHVMSQHDHGGVG